uniref:Uncharacterized protein n=1 Tax=Daphnia galeata TaxID=27404 RepID=A0A8J2S0V7_9CRUS|nr:unnamed protein product [Daphnia galeata]
MYQKQAHSVFLAVVVLGLLLAVSIQAYPSWSGRKKRSQVNPADVTQLLGNHLEYGSQTDDDRDSADIQETVFDDIWRYFRRNSKIC